MVKQIIIIVLGIIFANKINCKCEIIDDLREMNTYGIMSGVNKDLAKKIFGYYLDSSEYKSFGYYKGKSFEGGESVESFDSRVRNASNFLVKQDENIIAVVTHGGVFRSVYKNVLGKPEQILEIDDIATIEINYKNGVFSIENMNGIRTN